MKLDWDPLEDWVWGGGTFSLYKTEARMHMRNTVFPLDNCLNLTCHYQSLACNGPRDIALTWVTPEYFITLRFSFGLLCIITNHRPQRLCYSTFSVSSLLFENYEIASGDGGSSLDFNLLLRDSSGFWWKYQCITPLIYIKDFAVRGFLCMLIEISMHNSTCIHKSFCCFGIPLYVDGEWRYQCITLRVYIKDFSTHWHLG